MKTKNLLINFIVMAAISAGSLLAYHSFFQRKTAYVDLKKVFNNFQFKKELEAKYKTVAEQRNKMLDSLSFNLKILAKHLNEQKIKNEKIEESVVENFDYKRDEFLKLKRQIEEDNAALSAKYDGEILERLTQYVNEYGKLKDYDFIYGADGNGTIMYSNDKYNLSDEVCVYINNKYKGVE